MAVLFFYGRDSFSFGPYSPTEMRTLAAAGTILPSDLVWQEGDGRKLAASKVKNLFVAAAIVAPPPIVPMPVFPAPEPEAAAAAPPSGAFAAVEPKNTTRDEQPPKSKRVIRIRGGVLLNQDGATVRFFKKCEVCNHQDTTRSSAVIRSGCTRVAFFCRSCRKGRTVELFGV